MASSVEDSHIGKMRERETERQRERFCLLIMADGYKILSKFGTLGRSSNFLKILGY